MALVSLARAIRQSWRVAPHAMGARPLARGASTTIEFGQLRQNACNGDWVCFATGRSNRPIQTSVVQEGFRTTQGIAHDANCPFCFGNEPLSGASLLEVPGGGDPWSLRIVANKYPAVKMPSDWKAVERSRQERGSKFRNNVVLDNVLDAVGSHEVVIETPLHNSVLALGDLARVERLVRAWRDRGRELIHDNSWVHHVLYFKNQGTVGGASLLHPHSQLVALPIVPEHVQRSQDHAFQWFTEHNQSVWGRMLEEELDLMACSPGQHRIVDSNDEFVALVPFAALSPYSMWIVPRRDSAHFDETSDASLAAFAELLHRCLRRLHVCLKEPDFNLLIRSAPVANRSRQRAFNASTYYRWHATLFPRMGAGAMAGFEFASGIFSNSNWPEDDAEKLRRVEI
ncbi:hypothetical protein AB1Y20_015377 [Prymnesium parvum]|uniref:Galactose-1-phosphate uridyl transferase N-terminal domain-containing protein n=1 Tax=Prymnesium parvum TaxID=97485 RepID=A0AB34K2D7_PRYPA